MIILQKDLKHQCLLDVLFHFRINDRNLFTLIIDDGFTTETGGPRCQHHI